MLKRLLLGGLAACALMAGSAEAAETFTFTAGGDLIGPFHPIDWSDEEFRKVAQLFQTADLAFANSEGMLFDLAVFRGFPAAETGGGYPVKSLADADDIHKMGIVLVSTANNHATDYGPEGLIATLKALADAKIAQAGSGLSEAQARAPGYVSTDRGMAALVDTASTFTPMSVAGEAVAIGG